jgi:hypothetical protein
VSTRAAPFGLVAGPAPVATACHEAFGSTILEKKSLDWQRLESRGLGEMLGAPEVLIYGAGKEIVARDRGAYPKNLGSGETSSTEPSSGRLGFKMSRIWFDGLKFNCVVVGLLFGSDTVWQKLPNESSRNCSSK